MKIFYNKISQEI